MLRVTAKQAKKLGIKALLGDQCMRIWLTLPWPPTVNHLYATVHGRRVLSAQGREYKKKVAEICNKNPCHVVGDVSVWLWFYPPNNRKWDMSNLLKVLEDSLTEAGVWGDDSQIVDEHLHKRHPGGSYVTVEIIGKWPVQ